MLFSQWTPPPLHSDRKARKTRAPPALGMKPVVPEPGPVLGSRDGFTGVHPCKKGPGQGGQRPVLLTSLQPFQLPRVQGHPPPGHSSAQKYFAENCPGGSDSKASAYSAYHAGDPGSIPGSGKISWIRKWPPTPVFLPGKSHGWWNLIGYSPWGLKESDTTERLHFTSLHPT